MRHSKRNTLMKNRTWKFIDLSAALRVISLLLVLLPLASVHAQDVTISSSATVTASTSSVIVGDDFTNNGTYNAGNATLKVAGNWSNAGTFTASTSTVVFNGTGTQSISNTAGETFNNLTVDKSSGTLSLSNNAMVNSTLTFTNGLFFIGSNTLTLGTSASIGGTPSSSKMIVADGSGVVKKMYSGTGSFTFPIGDKTVTAEYSPYVVNFTSGAFSSAYVTARVVDAKHPNNSSTSHYLTRYWPIISSGITGFSCGIEGYYTGADVYGLENSMTCAKWNGSSWFDLATTPDAANNKIYGTVTSFGEFTAGEAAALPVELVSFTARLVKQNVELKWITATEINNYGFYVERNVISLNEGWEKIGFVDGHGTVNTPQSYSFINQLSSLDMMSKSISYRLKQIDRDGKFTYSNTIYVTLNRPQTFSLEQNYPNPFGAAILAGNHSTTISFSLAEKKHIRLKVYDIFMRDVVTLIDEERDAGSYSVTFNANDLPSGTYFYKLEAGTLTQIRKMNLMK